MVLRAAVVEDEQPAAQRLKAYLLRFGTEQELTVEITEFRDAVAFLDQYRPVFDVVFMDIELPHMNGMDASRKLREIDREILLVFVTNMAQYAVKGYEVDALDFIVKPVAYPDFAFKLKRVLNALQAGREREITISLPNQGLYRVSSSRLLYVEVRNHRLRYHMADGVLEAGGTLSKAEAELRTWGFLRCNSCYLVNPRHVEWVRGYVVRIGHDELQISHPKRREFMKGLSEWLAKGGR